MSEQSSQASSAPQRAARRIATEEAWQTPEIARALAEVAGHPSRSSDLGLLQSIYVPGPTGTPEGLLDQLLDLEDYRIKDMDANGVQMHLLLLTSPGVQMFDADTAVQLAALSNDRLAEVIGRHPDRFAGLATFPPQAPKRAVVEMGRAINQLGLNGFVVNSHTNSEYLDNPKYWPILEAAEALEGCIYIHPRGPSDGMAEPFRDYGLSGAGWGYGVETGTHAMRLIMSGVLDRFPRLKICIGHMGEAVHFWFWRLDNRFARLSRGGRTPRLELTPSEYFKRNFVITTSGQESHLALEYSIKALGTDNIMWAVDYPYQPTPSAVEFMDSAPVSEEDREKLYHLNAERVFHIKP